LHTAPLQRARVTSKDKKLRHPQQTHYTAEPDEGIEDPEEKNRKRAGVGGIENDRDTPGARL
jgi:hypothetical protein